VGEAVARLSALDAEIEGVRKAAREAGEREDLLRFQVGEIDKVAPKAGEDEALSAEIGRLRHADQLHALLRRAEGALYSDDGAITEALARVEGDLEQAARFDPSLERLVAPVEAARADLEEAGREIGRALRGLHGDPDRLAAAEERLHQIRRLLRKFGTVETAIAHRAQAQAELDALTDSDERITELTARRDAALREATQAAEALSARRHAEAVRLGAAITRELASLGMGEAKVEVSVAPIEEGGARLTPTGLDRVEFLIGTNPGEEPRALRKVASGGELSRALLALKRVLSGLGPVGLYVFDEVDTGVGGAIAEVIGRKLKEVARHHQVLCITHLPQVAVHGDTQFHVRKQVADGRTRSFIRRLTDTERVEETARMLGGVQIGTAAREAAAELIRQARTAP
jgi:DNA repair protein RecN (Recombination protein N)